MSKGGARHFAKPMVDQGVLYKCLGAHEDLIQDLGTYELVSRNQATDPAGLMQIIPLLESLVKVSSTCEGDDWDDGEWDDWDDWGGDAGWEEGEWNNKWRPSGSGTTSNARRARIQAAAQERDRLAALGNSAALAEKAKKEAAKAASMRLQAEKAAEQAAKTAAQAAEAAQQAAGWQKKAQERDSLPKGASQEKSVFLPKGESQEERAS
eukprot:s800_g20.t1